MHPKHTLATLELIRRADKTAAELKTTHRTVHKAEAAVADAEADVAYWSAHATRATSDHERDLLVEKTWRTVYAAHAGQPVDDTVPTMARAVACAELLGPFIDTPTALMRAAHKVIIQSSGGKDSVVAMLRAVQAARSAGCLNKLIVVHSNLGEHAEWPGVEDLVRRQAARFGLELRIVEPKGGMLGLVDDRGMFPDSKRRLCTAQLKRDALAPLRTQIIKELNLPKGEQAIIVEVFGIRAEESPARRLNSGQCCAGRTTRVRSAGLVSRLPVLCGAE